MTMTMIDGNASKTKGQIGVASEWRIESGCWPGMEAGSEMIRDNHCIELCSVIIEP